MLRRASWAPYFASILFPYLVTACALDVNGTGPSAVTVGPTSGFADVDAGHIAPDTGSSSGMVDATTPGPGPDSSGTVAPDAASAANDAADASTPSVPDASADDAGDNGGCAPGEACIVVPSGWTLVAFSEARNPCPAGFRQSPTDVVEGPDTTSACACGACLVANDPNCDTGAIEVLSSQFQDPSCSQGTPSTLPNDPAGTCEPYPSVTNNPPANVEYVPPPASGGTCTAQGTPLPNNVTYASQGRLCGADPTQAVACGDGQCAPSVDNAYAVCIAAPGSVTCPQGTLSVQHLVGTAADFSCSDCGCTVGADCTGMLQFFGDLSCRGLADTTRVDSVCRATGNGGNGPPNAIAAYEYQGDTPQNVSCTIASTSTTSSLILENEMTVCCAGP